jgi:hypothetical protein
MELKNNIEKIKFITNELEKISLLLEKSGGKITNVNDINLSDTPLTTAEITLVWAG